MNAVASYTLSDAHHTVMRAHLFTTVVCRKVHALIARAFGAEARTLQTVAMTGNRLSRAARAFASCNRRVAKRVSLSCAWQHSGDARNRL